MWRKINILEKKHVWKWQESDFLRIFFKASCKSDYSLDDTSSFFLLVSPLLPFQMQTGLKGVQRMYQGQRNTRSVCRHSSEIFQGIRTLRTVFFQISMIVKGTLGWKTWQFEQVIICFCVLSYWSSCGILHCHFPTAFWYGSLSQFRSLHLCI